MRKSTTYVIDWGASYEATVEINGDGYIQFLSSESLENQISLSEFGQFLEGIRDTFEEPF